MPTPRKKLHFIAPVDENAVQRLSRSELTTSRALLFHTNNRELRLITTHPVSTRTGRAPVIGPGRPLTPGDEAEIYALLTSRPAGDGRCLVFPPRLLYRDAARIAWWVPGAVRPMHLRSSQGQRSIVTTWPTLAFCVVERTLYLTALRDAEQPTADTAVYHAPLPNTHASTALCTGDAILPLGCDIGDMAAWEAVVFDTAFTHPNFAGGITAVKGDNKTTVESYWQARDQDLTPFPTARLATTGRTLGQWLHAPAGGSR